MKYASVIILSILFSVLPLYDSFAQRGAGQPAPVREAQQQAPRSDCNDGVDNDKDGTIDKTGRTVGTKVFSPDPDCQKEGATSEGKPTEGFGLNIAIKNPLKVDTIEGAIKLFMDAVLRIAIPFIVIFFIWSGINFILARGNKDKIGEAKKMFWYTILGTLLILGAWTITNIIVGTVNSVTG